MLCRLTIEYDYGRPFTEFSHTAFCSDTLLFLLLLLLPLLLLLLLLLSNFKTHY